VNVTFGMYMYECDCVTVFLLHLPSWSFNL